MPATAPGVAPAIDHQDNSDVLRRLLRQAIDQAGWKHEALAAALELPDRHYLSKMLSGEKPISLKHLVALPDDIEVIFARLYAESFGQIVAQPSEYEQKVGTCMAALGDLMRTFGLPGAGAPLKAALKK